MRRSCRHILESFWILPVSTTLQQPVAHQCVEATGEHCRGYTQGLLEFIKPCSLMHHDFSQDQWSPPLSHYFKGLSDRTFHLAETLALHKRQFSLAFRRTKPTLCVVVARPAMSGDPSSASNKDYSE